MECEALRESTYIFACPGSQGAEDQEHVFVRSGELLASVEALGRLP